MRKAKDINYNPAISVKENATRNGVSEATIRYHIKVKSVDRRYERKLHQSADYDFPVEIARR